MIGRGPWEYSIPTPIRAGGFGYRPPFIAGFGRLLPAHFVPSQTIIPPPTTIQSTPITMKSRSAGVLKKKKRSSGKKKTSNKKKLAAKPNAKPKAVPKKKRRNQTDLFEAIRKKNMGDTSAYVKLFQKHAKPSQWTTGLTEPDQDQEDDADADYIDQ